MNTEIPVTTAVMGCLFYDAECRICSGGAQRFAAFLTRHGFRLAPLQTPGTPERLHVTAAALLTRIHLLTTDGRVLTGADACLEIGRQVRWARPWAVIARIPLVLPLARRTYDWVAANRYCINGSCPLPRRDSTRDWLPLLLLPLLALATRAHVGDWVFMWLMAMALFAGCKWLTYRRAVARGTPFTFRQAISYLAGWVGMEPEAFAKVNRGTLPPWQALLATGRVFLGAALVWGVVRNVIHPLLAGWVGMSGIILLLHFGFFQLLALAWRCVGVPVKPLMQAPLLATSVGDFWGKRWNTGFHALVHELVFRPVLRRTTLPIAVLTVFLVSGLVHELVITLPARGGYGLPTLYFLLQGFGLLLEHRHLGRRLGLGSKLAGRAFMLVVTAGPVFWLFPPVFVHHIILPMLHGIGAT